MHRELDMARLILLGYQERIDGLGRAVLVFLIVHFSASSAMGTAPPLFASLQASYENCSEEAKHQLGTEMVAQRRGCRDSCLSSLQNASGLAFCRQHAKRPMGRNPSPKSFLLVPALFLIGSGIRKLC